jgi:glycosyltransferase involved in cell wall biosynthesis
MPARCRIFLFTYKRNTLLKRAVQSLLDQSFTDWVCELHNDCPEDGFPEEYISSLGDPRFVVYPHPVNLGTTKSFNLAFRNFPEKYGSMLEDDNWWEPEFLATMTQLMDENPQLEVAWCNMHVWKELPGSQWENLHELIWKTSLDLQFEKGDPIQALGSAHSTGAMIYRSAHAARYRIPENSLSDAVELIRERTFGHPIRLVAKPLANFSQTIQTSRSKKAWEWSGTQVLMLSSYLHSFPDPEAKFKEMLTYYRNLKQNKSLIFFLANLFFLKKRTLYFQFSITEWLKIAKWCLKNLTPLRSYLQKQDNVHQFLLERTGMK